MVGVSPTSNRLATAREPGWGLTREAGCRLEDILLETKSGATGAPGEEAEGSRIDDLCSGASHAFI